MLYGLRHRHHRRGLCRHSCLDAYNYERERWTDGTVSPCQPHNHHYPYARTTPTTDLASPTTALFLAAPDISAATDYHTERRDHLHWGRRVCSHDIYLPDACWFYIPYYPHTRGWLNSASLMNHCAAAVLTLFQWTLWRLTTFDTCPICSSASYFQPTRYRRQLPRRPTFRAYLVFPITLRANTLSPLLPCCYYSQQLLPPAAPPYDVFFVYHIFLPVLVVYSLSPRCGDFDIDQQIPSAAPHGPFLLLPSTCRCQFHVVEPSACRQTL